MRANFYVQLKTQEDANVLQIVLQGIHQLAVNVFMGQYLLHLKILILGFMSSQL